MVHSSLLLSMPSEEEPTISAMLKALAAHGMKLERARARFHNHKEGGSPAYRLMQEKECSRVVAIKVGDLEEENTWNHFVAWDGNVIYNSPHNCKVNLRSDCTKTRREARLCSRSCSLKKILITRSLCCV